MARRIPGLFAPLCALVVGLLAACSSPPQPPPEPSISSVEENLPGNVTRRDVVTASATVESIDHKTRMVTLLGSDGETITFRADDAIRNLDQVKRGDLVQATYYRSVAIQLRQPGQVTPGVSAGTTTMRADPGSQPAAGGASTVTVVATVEALDRANQSATLEFPDGTLHTIQVRNPQHFDVAKVGDQVEITYTEAVAISVEKPTRR
jgi:hypothetical protein